MHVGELLYRIAEHGASLRCGRTEDRLHYSPAGALPPDLVAELKEHKLEVIRIMREDEEYRRMESWDEDTASRLIEDAFAYLCEEHLKAGKPDFNPAAVHGACVRIDKAYGAEDMRELRRAVRAFVVAGIEGFRRRQRAA